ncbi:MAG: GAF domain-containing sensor histidine kinase [bacterium]
MSVKKPIRTTQGGLIEVIREVALRLEKSLDEKEIFNELADAIKSKYPDTYIIITVVSPGTNNYKIVVFKGFEKFMKRIETLLGFNALSFEYPLSGLSKEDLRLNSNGKLNLVEEGISALAPLKIPRTITNSINQLLRIDKVYTMGLILDQIHFGNITLFAKKTCQLNQDDIHFIETLAFLASIALRRTVAVESIRESEDRYRTLIENAPVAILIHRKGVIEYVNTAAVKLLNYDSSTSLIGRNALDLMHPDDQKTALERIGNMYITGIPAPVAEERFLTKDQQIITLQVAANIIQYKGGPASLVFGLDVTSLKEAEKRVKIYSQELEEANIAKDKFFSIIAHDLKGPFNSILGFSDILYTEYNEYSDEERKHFIRNISSSAHNTFRLLENLLEWSRAQTNRLDFRQEVLELSSIINDIILLLRGQAEVKDVHMFSAVDFNTRVFADENMVKTVIRNLLSNAIKFSKRGGNIRIMERQINDPETGQETIEILVKDEGVGMSRSVVDQLFRIDQMIKTLGTDNEKGTGLGLILCKELVSRNKGRIWAESNPGKGSVLHFTLPKA